MKVPGCTCDIFDIGWRCEQCVAACSAAGHPYTNGLTNGVHCWCGLPPGTVATPAREAVS